MKNIRRILRADPVLCAEKICRKQDFNALHHRNKRLLFLPLQFGNALIAGNGIADDTKPFIRLQFRSALSGEQARQKISQIKNPDISLTQIEVDISRKLSVQEQKISEMNVPVDQLLRQPVVYASQLRRHGQVFLFTDRFPGIFL